MPLHRGPQQASYATGVVVVVHVLEFQGKVHCSLNISKINEEINDYKTLYHSQSRQATKDQPENVEE